MLNRMMRTWWVQGAFGALVAFGIAGASNSPWDLGQWALLLLQVVIAGAFFFEAGVLWARRTHDVEVESRR
jgi:hypothetical protein